MEPHSITDVAIYLRKSRDESDGLEDVLLKHQTLLVDLAEQRGWKYTMYREIGSSDSIEARSEMQRLLLDVEKGLCDAVLVVNLDRLSRGDMEQQGRIRRIFRDAKTLVVTPQKVYDFADDDQEIETDIESLFARFEYVTIKKRLRRGKQQGARLGHFVNGRPAYGYMYVPETKKLDVDPDKAPTYRQMVEWFLSGRPCYEIAWELNRLGVPSATGKKWNEQQVYRLLTSEVHRGWLVYGKTRGSGHKCRLTNKPLEKLPPDQWTVVKEAHPALKSEAEHAEILAILERRKVVPVRSRRGTYVLSGVVRCGQCRNTHQFLVKQNGKMYTKICQHSDPYGNRCGNRGLDTDVLLTVFNERLTGYKSDLVRAVPRENDESVRLERLLKNQDEELRRLEAALERTLEMYEMGDLTKTQYMERRDKRKDEIASKKEEIARVKSSLGHHGSMSHAERLARIAEFEEVWLSGEVPAKEKNRLLKRICQAISYVRIGDEVKVDIGFL